MGFRFRGSPDAEALTDRKCNVVAETEVALHLRAAQVDVAIFEADFFVLDGFFRGREGRQAAVV